MITDFMAQTQSAQHELELTQRLERRRLAAERAASQFGGDRLALIAHLAKVGRARRAAPTQPVSC
jgi:hypothetical protein